MFLASLGSVSHQTDYTFYQSVALPPLVAPAQAWKPKSANMNTLASTAAAASAQNQLGTSLLVFSIEPLESVSGSQHFALTTAAARVSDGDISGQKFLK